MRCGDEGLLLGLDLGQHDGYSCRTQRNPPRDLTSGPNHMEVLERQIAEVQMRVALMNRFNELGNAEIERRS